MKSIQKMDPIILGHNTFFGVDHLSAERGRERESFFSDTRRIAAIIEEAVNLGVGGLMLSTHARAPEVLASLKDSSIASRLRLYPLLPYVQKYVVAANQKGLLNVVLDALAEAEGTNKLRLIWSGAKAVVGKDFRSMLKSLIQAELQPLSGFEMPQIFLHDAFTDLALAFDLKEIFEFYVEEIRKTYQAEAAFTTKNLPLFLERYHAYGLGTPVVMTHVNACGFSMNPSREAVESSLKKYPARILAMSTLASGFLKPAEAYRYLATVTGIESVVVGVSTSRHLTETVTCIQQNLFAPPTLSQVG